MVSVNPHFTEAGLRYLYENYFIDRQKEEVLRAQREIVYTIDRDWLLNFIDGGHILDVGCSAVDSFCLILMTANGPSMGSNLLKTQLNMERVWHRCKGWQFSGS